MAGISRAPASDRLCAVGPRRCADADGNGAVDYLEFRAAMQRLGVLGSGASDVRQIRHLWSVLDESNTGSIDCACALYISTSLKYVSAYTSEDRGSVQ